MPNPQVRRSSPSVPRAVLAAAPLAALALALPAPASASSGQYTMFQAPTELASADGTLRTRTLDEIRAMGVNWLRINITWHDVAPAPNSRKRPAALREADPASYPAAKWVRYDHMVADARARGFKLLVTITGPVPKWATRSRRSTVARPAPARFRNFVAAVGRRYGDQVAMWSIWNEPNHPGFLRPQYTGKGKHRRPASPGIYRKLYIAGRQGLRDAGRGRDRVLMGETAPRGNSNVVGPLAFLRGSLCLDGRYRKRRGCKALDVDGWAHHPYTTPAGPWFVSQRTDDVTIGSLSRLTRALDKAGRARATKQRRPAIYLTEFGVQSHPDPYNGVPVARQAEHRSIGEWIAYRNPRVRAFSQYLMRDDNPRPGSRTLRWSGFESGLRFSGGRMKTATYRSFRLPLVALRHGRSKQVRLWGLVRPASGKTTVRIEYRNRKGKWRRLKDKGTNARGYWNTTTSYRAGRTYRVRWTSPQGTRYQSAGTRVYRPR